LGRQLNCRPNNFNHYANGFNCRFTLFPQIPSVRFLRGVRFLTAGPYDRFLRFLHTLLAQLAQLFFTLFLGVIGVLRAAWSGCAGWVKSSPKILRRFFDLPKKMNYA